MSDQGIQEQIKALEAEAQQVKSKKQQLARQMKAGLRKAQAIIDLAEAELKKSQHEPDSSRRARLIKMNQLRLVAARTNYESLELVQALDPERNPPPQLFTMVELLSLKNQYLLTEYNLLNYEPIMGKLEEALGVRKSAPAAPADDAAAAAAGLANEAKSPTGPLGARPGIPQRPGMPPRPGVPAGTGPLPRPAVPGAGLPPRPPLPRPAVPGAPRPGVPRPPMGTGPLGGRPGTGQLQEAPPLVDPNLGEQLKQACEDPATKDKLKDLLIRVRDLEVSLAPLRGDETGSLSIALEDAGQLIRQVAGKVYYINRVVTSLGALGEKVSFLGERLDPALEKLLSSADDPGAPAPGAPGNGQAGQQVQMAGRLKSLFKS